MAHSQKPKSVQLLPSGAPSHPGLGQGEKAAFWQCLLATSKATGHGMFQSNHSRIGGGGGGSPTYHLPYLRPLAVILSWAFRNCEHPGGRITTINVAAKYCKTPNSPICVLPPKRENSLHRHSLIWQANSKPYWQPQACFPNQTAMKPKIVLPALC